MNDVSLPTLKLPTLNSWADHCHALNKRRRDPRATQPIERDKGEALALIRSDLGEALEALRTGGMDDELPHRKGIEVKLAEVWCVMPSDPFGPYYHVDPASFGFAVWPTEQLAPRDNACLGCHRIGTGETCRSLTRWMTGAREHRGKGGHVRPSLSSSRRSTTISWLQ